MMAYTQKDWDEFDATIKAMGWPRTREHMIYAIWDDPSQLQGWSDDEEALLPLDLRMDPAPGVPFPNGDPLDDDEPTEADTDS